MEDGCAPVAHKQVAALSTAPTVVVRHDATGTCYVLVDQRRLRQLRDTEQRCTGFQSAITQYARQSQGTRGSSQQSHNTLSAPRGPTNNMHAQRITYQPKPTTPHARHSLAHPMPGTAYHTPCQPQPTTPHASHRPGCRGRPAGRVARPPTAAGTRASPASPPPRAPRLRSPPRTGKEHTRHAFRASTDVE